MSTSPSPSTPLHHPPTELIRVITRKEITAIYNSQREAGRIGTFSSRKASVKSVIDELIERYRLDIDISLTNTLIRRLGTYLDRKKGRGQWTLTAEEEQETFHNVVRIVPEQEPVAEQEAVLESPATPATPRGRPRSTDFASCSKKTKVNYVNEQAKQMENFAASKSIPVAEAVQLVSTACSKRAGGLQTEMRKVSIPDATALMYNLGLSVGQYQELRLFNLEQGLEYPTRNHVVEFKSSLHPPIQSFQLKSCVEIESLFENTLMGLLNIIGLDTTSTDDILLYDMSAKFGADGSGSHNIRHQRINRYCHSLHNWLSSVT